ncbi:helicase UvrB [Megasphaera cerevisiae DSM 20462]|jgi:protein arginine kinase activator|uniref:Helicase UvrB n=1 Tax=Megasphaera cerevisiae DSM 20462 TaxID=1122219 RepID=A0A0J6WWX7_9FIRM|nr:UvrB/UvrC motif-containing protein [Megasphaera cerevisiae]KMO87109.1 helicase UvrB [Megasphaera cerevisiae DSM 20462]MCI1751160.1 UvrB/UvrC motif-containing protein [Megasphaera cerevisiae]SJZ45532.1 Protein-arginine kinase activator protein McsA [Megasphaera cerevisiae DSM 20462]
MLCDVCKKQEAVVHITKIENGQRTDMHLCAECAKKQSQFAAFNDFNIVDNDFFRKMAYPNYTGESADEPRCASCGMTYSDFNRAGKFGCPDCYEAFKEEIPPLMRRIHGHSKHVGKVPNRGTGVFRTVTQIKRLRQHLQKLVRDERYEEAAKVRDEIRVLQRQIPQQDASKEG